MLPFSYEKPNIIVRRGVWNGPPDRLVGSILQFVTLEILATFTPYSVSSPETKRLYIPLNTIGVKWSIFKNVQIRVWPFYF
jgi:hypothetical protein